MPTNEIKIRNKHTYVQVEPGLLKQLTSEEKIKLPSREVKIKIFAGIHTKTG